MLELTDFSMQTLNDRGRKTRRYSQIAKLQFNYTLAKNITTTSGIKTLYLRIIRPDGEVMSKSDQNLFPFEDTELLYSLSKQFEYAGEELSDVLYWIFCRRTSNRALFVQNRRLIDFQICFL